MVGFFKWWMDRLYTAFLAQGCHYFKTLRALLG